jgi:hypothetical protein
VAFRKPSVAKLTLDYEYALAVITPERVSLGTEDNVDNKNWPHPKFMGENTFRCMVHIQTLECTVTYTATHTEM